MPEVRLIDANALKAEARALGNIGDNDFERGFCWGVDEVVNLIESAPTIDPEVQHGRWMRKGCLKKPEYDRTTDLNAYAHRCSACDQVSYFPIDFKDTYCRRCGAKMDATCLDEESEARS